MKKINLDEIKEKKVGYVSIIGRPNTWKSTFINSLIWEKISIISNIPQTTRKKIIAIYNDIDSQIIFFDTPWIHKNEKNINKKINEEAVKSLKESEIILYFIDSSRKYWDEEKKIENILEFIKVPIIKVYTKIDLPLKINIPIWDNIFKISSVTKFWFEKLISNIKSYLKLWYILYPEDYYTDQNIYFRISEIIREKVFLYTFKEIPHSIYVETEEIENEESLLKIQAYIYTKTDSQRYIIIWKNWNLITKIWTESRSELERIFWKKIFLSLKVKTHQKWKKKLVF